MVGRGFDARVPRGGRLGRSGFWRSGEKSKPSPVSLLINGWDSLREHHDRRSCDPLGAAGGDLPPQFGLRPVALELIHHRLDHAQASRADRTGGVGLEDDVGRRVGWGVRRRGSGSVTSSTSLRTSSAAASRALRNGS